MIGNLIYSRDTERMSYEGWRLLQKKEGFIDTLSKGRKEGLST